MAGDKFLRYNGAGVIAEVAGTDSSAGAANAGDIVSLDSAGKLPANMMPTGVGADIKNMQASEALAAGDFVNIHNVAGAFRIRKADATGANASKRAHGFVKAGVASAASGDVYFEGDNDAVSGLTPGDVWLGTTAGAATSTPPSGTGQTVQHLGVATSATSVNVELGEPIILA